MFAYIDDYILSPRATADDHFHHLASTLFKLGLPGNSDKHTSPCRSLTCLGIRFDLDNNTMSIDPAKYQSICTECLATKKSVILARHHFNPFWASFYIFIIVYNQSVFSQTECLLYLELSKVPTPGLGLFSHCPPVH